MSTLQIFQSGTEVITTRKVGSVNGGITIEPATLCVVELQFEDEENAPLLNLKGKLSAFPADAFERFDSKKKK